MLGVTYNNTFVELPRIYYDVQDGSALNVPMNMWYMGPQDLL